MSLTTDHNDPDLNKINENGQNEKYVILSEEERKRGFTRPYRDSYVHVGAIPHYKRIWRILDHDDENRKKGYVAVMVTIEDENGKPTGGPYVTQEEFNAWEQGKRIGGCGTLTKMHREIAETYAREPSFYGATFCVGCRKHLPVTEFVWDGTNEYVGS